MRRKKHDPVLDLIPPLVGLFILGFFFVPAFRLVLITAAAIAFLAVLVFIIYRVATRGRRAAVCDREISLHTYLPATPPPESLSDKLRALDWFQFEKLAGAIFQEQGYSVHRSGGAKPDGGIDLVIERAGEKTIVQCKQWKSWKIQLKHVREFLGTLTDAQIPRGIFITLNGYTNDARIFADKHNLQLLDESNLIRLLESVDWRWNPEIKSALEETKKCCPRCDRDMVLRTAENGPRRGNQFWGCSAYPRCTGILNCA